MKITIIETGLPPEDIRADWPTYPAMFEALIGQADDGFTYETVSIVQGDPFPEPHSLDAVIITGSAYGVYDDVDWMAPLMNFIRQTATANVPQFGVCFGHQAMAQALGGKVVKSDKGWGVGRHAYDTPNRPKWMASGPERFALAVSHQDQVISVPPGTKTIARSDFCEYAGLAYAGSPSASLQGHPEFSADFGTALHKLRIERIGKDLVNEAIASFADPLDSLQVARWMADFFWTNRKA